MNDDDPIEELRLMLSDLAQIAATLALELNRNRLLQPEGPATIADALDRMATVLETHDPTDPDEMTATAANLHSAALLLRRDSA